MNAHTGCNGLAPRTDFRLVPGPRRNSLRMKYMMPVIIAAVSLALSCATTSSSGGDERPHNIITEKKTVITEQIQKVPLFPRLFESVKKWPRMHDLEYRDFFSDAESAENPISSALYETCDKNGYLYISHVGQHVAITYFDSGFNIKDVKTFQSKLGFSTCMKQGLILILHRHPGTGMFVDTKVFVNTTGTGIDLQYNVE